VKFAGRLRTIRVVRQSVTAVLDLLVDHILRPGDVGVHVTIPALHGTLRHGVELLEDLRSSRTRLRPRRRARHGRLCGVAYDRGGLAASVETSAGSTGATLLVSRASLAVGPAHRQGVVTSYSFGARPAPSWGTTGTDFLLDLDLLTPVRKSSFV
jgi:hypothetical protein